jgi:hypothetical protein
MAENSNQWRQRNGCQLWQWPVMAKYSMKANENVII